MSCAYPCPPCPPRILTSDPSCLQPGLCGCLCIPILMCLHALHIFSPFFPLPIPSEWHHCPVVMCLHALHIFSPFPLCPSPLSGIIAQLSCVSLTSATHPHLFCPSALFPDMPWLSYIFPPHSVSSPPTSDHISHTLRGRGERRHAEGQRGTEGNMEGARAGGGGASATLGCDNLQLNS